MRFVDAGGYFEILTDAENPEVPQDFGACDGPWLGSVAHEKPRSLAAQPCCIMLTR